MLDSRGYYRVKVCWKKVDIDSREEISSWGWVTSGVRSSDTLWPASHNSHRDRPTWPELMPLLSEFHWILKISPVGFTSHPHSCQTCSEIQCSTHFLFLSNIFCHTHFHTLLKDRHGAWLSWWMLLDPTDLQRNMSDQKVVNISITFNVCICAYARDSLVWMKMSMMMVPTLPVW